MLKLYEITSEILRRLSDVAENAEGVPPVEGDEDEDVQEGLLSELESWDNALESKLEGCARVVRNLSAEQTALREESARLAKRASATANRERWLKEYMMQQLLRIGKRRVDAGIFKIRIQKSPMKINILDEELIPIDFKERVESWKIDKKSIAQLVKETGEIVEGVEAHLGEHLRIS